ncbi:3-hydroxyacyl-ACP dehydratase FabZ [Coxiella endosymbiont of Amblyomma americanum]|uniref:3-hydroxyacyl-ACP dehydratase FabZ n=1 Tax=Coxiella endosymbiont of Amblyomma americanum TaxID=325775 RepID=UPI0005801F64|nr:3-hydroxyacyl-ACP dehydratase FabZ [Coxiella endosymbiont of Amblyomma americanum]AJC50310.1 3-hydroxyacyl-ACP dehydratase [Coxiella endosymbiont of Amblyomma americanum]AUJ58660.1 beta-hydroxyacyl-ACP dehydratase [Coxiella-like endosymbiont of Amblyomma americanum]
MSVMETREIKQYIPHRYPFLLVDRVIAMEKHKSLIAIKNITANEPFFMGHFPVRPIMPGVLIIESLAQSAGILIVKSLNLPEYHKEIYFFAGVDNARFKRIVEPGDQLVLEIKVLKSGRLWKFEGEAKVEGKLACRAEFITIKDK